MDLSIRIEGTRLNIRAGAIVSLGEKILVCQLPGKDWWFLPGGRVALNESTEETIRRELREEVGGDWELGGPRILSENFFDIEGESFHEMCLYYWIYWKGEELTSEMRDSEETFRWVTKGELRELKLLPEFLKEACFVDEDGLRHVITRSN